MELVDLLKRAADKSTPTLSQIILPFCSSSSDGERPPVALLTGNINFKNSLRLNGQLVPFEAELQKLESEIASLKLSKAQKGEVIDLTAEMKRLQVDKVDDSPEKEIEIKEEWTERDEALILQRRERKPKTDIKSILKENPIIKPSKLDEDIEELLKLAELEEEQNVNESNVSKIKEIKREVKEEIKKPVAGSVQKLNLPKIDATNSLVGDIIERVPEPVKDKNESAALKKSSLFSLRKNK